MMNAKGSEYWIFPQRESFSLTSTSQELLCSTRKTKESPSAEKLLFALGSAQKSDLNNQSGPTVVSCLSTWGLTLNN